MTPIAHLRSLFQPVLAGLLPDPATVGGYLDMIRPASDPANGDYQANFAMKLKAVLGRESLDIAKPSVSPPSRSTQTVSVFRERSTSWRLIRTCFSSMAKASRRR